MLEILRDLVMGASKALSIVFAVYILCFLLIIKAAGTELRRSGVLLQPVVVLALRPNTVDHNVLLVGNTFCPEQGQCDFVSPD